MKQVIIILLLLFGFVVYPPVIRTEFDAEMVGPVGGPAPTVTPTVTPVSPP